MKALRFTIVAGIACAVMVGVTFRHTPGAATPAAAPAALPLPTLNPAGAGTGLQTAVLSGGCFWGVQGVFEHVRGVKQVLAGYAGGLPVTANYELVSTGTTGHAESVKIVFDPAVISYGEILRVFFSVATDPTQVGGQYPDQGSQYRSEIFYADTGQQRIAQAYVAQLAAAKAFSRPIATRIDPLKGFYPAETYHQDYLVRHPDEPYIATYDLPKVEALRTLMPSDYLPQPVLALAPQA
jgi:peptide-methionine (S)-S-oxide reductase